MIVEKNNRVTWLVLLLAAVAFALFASLQWQADPVSPTTAKPEIPAYQTGKAFETIEPQKPAPVTSGKTPEELIGEADEIIARANEIIARHQLGDTELTAEQKQAAERQIADSERRMSELETKLTQ